MEKSAEVMPPQHNEGEQSVSFLGVELPIARNREGIFVPRKEAYADYINDDFSLKLQSKIAIAFAQEYPILIEGGTSIGKTTTVKKMAADLGWEVHYVNLNGATDVQDLMGRYIPNPHKTKPEDPEYIFADGKVTSGLRQEDGRIKVIILDEFNAATPNILIRLHEVLDALERDGDVILQESASETVATNKRVTKIIALMNPPDREYFGREPLDPAQLRRWVYQKEVTNLPLNSFSHAIDTLFGVATDGVTRAPTEHAVLKARKHPLGEKQVAEIPGMALIIQKYKEFHIAAKKMIKARKLAEDQPQRFTFDDRMEPKRIHNFVTRFYAGDINETFQKALRYYYVGKLESEEDRKKLEELIAHVSYTPQSVSKRKGIERKEEEEKNTSAGAESAETTSEATVVAELTNILSRDGVSSALCWALAGASSPEAMKLRERLLIEGANKDYIAGSLAGVATSSAMKLRKRLLSEGADKDYIALSLAGVATSSAMKLRKRLLSEGADKDYIARSLAGVATLSAMELRERLLSEGADKDYIALSLVGVATLSAMKLRERLLIEGANKSSIAGSLVGVATLSAMKLRERLLSEGANKNSIAGSLVGVATLSAMELRERLLREGANKNSIAGSLAGVFTPEATELRDRLGVGARAYTTKYFFYDIVVIRYEDIPTEGS